MLLLASGSTALIGSPGPLNMDVAVTRDIKGHGRSGSPKRPWVVRFIDAALIVGAPPTWSIAMVGSGQNGTPKTSAEWLAAVERCERDAELFMAYDLARQGLEEFPDDLALKHRAVLCLASTGAREQAVEIFRRLGLDEVIENPPADIPETLFLDLLTLQARLLKDEAVATCGRERSEKLTRAQELYDAAYRRLQHAGNPGSYYPGINGATLRLLTGDTDGAQALAYQILNDIAAQPIRDKAYYELATELEAQLIVGDVDAAAATARQIITRLKTGSEHDYRALASTIRQLRLVITAKQFAPQTLADLAPPLVIHYLGHIISAPGAPGRFLAHEETAVRQKITECFAERQVGFAYGSLAAGADIMFAEAALEQGAILNVVLPFVEEDYRLWRRISSKYRSGQLAGAGSSGSKDVIALQPQSASPQPIVIWAMIVSSVTAVSWLWGLLSCAPRIYAHQSNKSRFGMENRLPVLPELLSMFDVGSAQRCHKPSSPYWGPPSIATVLLLIIAAPNVEPERCCLATYMASVR